jgi:predicted metal-dependent phosphoesterase TrpH
MLIDLHVHTAVSSPCSQIDPAQLVKAAADTALDALCVTEHEETEGAEVAYALGKRGNFLVLRGIEVYTDLGDMIVFGPSRERYPTMTPFKELLAEVHSSGGILVLCHPCRGAHDLFDTMEPALADFLLSNVDAVETRNGGSSPEANQAAERMADRYGLPGVGGSDAHFLMQLGRCLTVFERVIRNEEDLVREIKAGRCRAASASELEASVMPRLWG